MGYIPTMKFKGITIKASCRHTQMNLFHLCMHDLLAPIASIGETGIEMMSGDGIWHWCHPIFTVFVGDYPEQILVTCTYSRRCPKCTVPHDQLGEYTHFPLRDFDDATETYRLADGDIHAFHTACRRNVLKLKPSEVRLRALGDSE